MSDYQETYEFPGVDMMVPPQEAIVTPSAGYEVDTIKLENDQWDIHDNLKKHDFGNDPDYMNPSVWGGKFVPREGDNIYADCKEIRETPINLAVNGAYYNSMVDGVAWNTGDVIRIGSIHMLRLYISSTQEVSEVWWRQGGVNALEIDMDTITCTFNTLYRMWVLTIPLNMIDDPLDPQYKDWNEVYDEVSVTLVNRTPTVTRTFLLTNCSYSDNNTYGPAGGNQYVPGDVIDFTFTPNSGLMMPGVSIFVGTTQYAYFDLECGQTDDTFKGQFIVPNNNFEIRGGAKPKTQLDVVFNGTPAANLSINTNIAWLDQPNAFLVTPGNPRYKCSGLSAILGGGTEELISGIQRKDGAYMANLLVEGRHVYSGDPGHILLAATADERKYANVIFQEDPDGETGIAYILNVSGSWRFWNQMVECDMEDTTVEIQCPIDYTIINAAILRTVEGPGGTYQEVIDISNLLNVSYDKDALITFGTLNLTGLIEDDDTVTIKFAAHTRWLMIDEVTDLNGNHIDVSWHDDTYNKPWFVGDTFVGKFKPADSIVFVDVVTNAPQQEQNSILVDTDADGWYYISFVIKDEYQHVMVDWTSYPAQTTVYGWGNNTAKIELRNYQ